MLGHQMQDEHTAPLTVTSHEDWFKYPSSDVEGWLPSIYGRAFNACLAAQEHHKIIGSIAEIGVYHGKTFIGLARAARPDERVLGIDVFEFNGQNFRDRFEENIRRFVPREQWSTITLQAEGSLKVTHLKWQQLLDRPARLVHIDGAHVHKAVLYDLSLAASYLTRGGLIIFDDFCSEYFPDVTTGIIDGLRAHPHIRPIAITPRLFSLGEGSSKLICGLRGGLAIYEEALINAFPDLRATRREFIGEKNVLLFVEPGA